MKFQHLRCRFPNRLGFYVYEGTIEQSPEMPETHVIVTGITKHTVRKATAITPVGFWQWVLYYLGWKDFHSYEQVVTPSPFKYVVPRTNLSEIRPAEEE